MEDDRPGKIFVGGLNFDIDEEEFEKIFSKFGKITEVLLKRDPKNKKSRGFGFITYENPSDAEEAVKSLDKKEIQGKMIHVDQAVKPGGERGGRGGFRGRGRGGFRDSRGGGMSRGRGGFRGRGGDRGRGDRGRGFGGRGRDFGDRLPPRNNFDDDRRGPPGKSFAPRRDNFDRGFDRDGRGPPTRRDDDRDRFGSSLDRDRYGSSGLGDRRGRDPYPSSPPRGLDRDLGSYRDFPPASRDYSPPPRDYGMRDRGITRDYGSSSLPTRDTLSRDPYRREDYPPQRDSRDYGSPRDPLSRDYLSRDNNRSLSRDFDRGLPPRDSYDSYGRDRLSGPPGRSYGG